MKLFFDTEFTNLSVDNKLISLALVNEREEFFYAELTDTYALTDCSEFVVSYVLPFLRGGAFRMTSYECALKLSNWLEKQGECIIASDAPSWDLPHLHRLLGDLWPKNILKNEFYLLHIPGHLQEDLVLEYNYDIHNALDDALVMKKVYDLKNILKF